MYNDYLVSRLAKSLVELDLKAGVDHDKRIQILDCLVKLVDKDKELEKFLEAPQIPLKNKKEIIDILVADKTDSNFIHFLYLVLQKKHWRYLSKIVKEYHKLSNDKLGVWEAVVVTAYPIEDNFKEEIRVKLEKIYNKKILLESKVDPQIMGGAQLITGNQLLDLSVLERLKNLKETLLA